VARGRERFQAQAAAGFGQAAVYERPSPSISIIMT